MIPSCHPPGILMSRDGSPVLALAKKVGSLTSLDIFQNGLLPALISASRCGEEARKTHPPVNQCAKWLQAFSMLADREGP